MNTVVITARSHCSDGCTRLEARIDKHRDLYVNALLPPSSCNTSDEEAVFGKQTVPRTMSESQHAYYMLYGLGVC